MRQAILITAYKNLQHIVDIVRFFNNDYHFFIHVDRNSAIPNVQITELKNLTNVVLVSQKYKTNWASLNHVRAMLLLMNEAVKSNVEYIHLITGHDFPIQSPGQFGAFLKQNKGVEFLENFSLPTQQWNGGGLNRLEYFYLYDFINFKKHFFKVNFYFTLIQEKLRWKRNLGSELPPLFGGGSWWTLTSPCVRYVCDYVEQHPKFFNRFRYTFCPEEILFPTIIMNSPFASQVRSDGLRFIVWERRNGNLPANLDESDWTAIMESQQLFARRFEYPVSTGLLDRIKGRFASKTTG